MKVFPFKDKDRMDMMALGLCLFALSFWVILLSYKFFHFGYNDWDFAFFSQGMWNLSHGSMYVSLFNANIFSNHANLIAYLILPIYKIFPHPLTLIFLKVISYLMAAVILYILAKEKLDPLSAILLLWLYLSYPPNMFGLLYEFDFESLAPGVLMLILYFYVKDRWLEFLIGAVVLILIKENLPLIILAFSIHALFVKKDKIRWVIIPGILALTSFYLLIFIFIPYISGLPLGREMPYYYIGQNYKALGGSLVGILSSVIFHPVKIWSCMMTRLNLNFFVAIFNPLMYLPIGAPGILFLVSPIFLQHLLSASPTEHDIRFFYVMTIAPVLFLATIETLTFFNKNLNKTHRLVLFLLLLINIVILSVNFHTFKIRILMTDSLHETNERVNDRWELVRLIPPDASVVASFSFLTQLSQRNNLDAFYKIYSLKYQNDEFSYRLPFYAQYALIDINDPWFFTESDYKLTLARAKKFLLSGDWIVLKRYGRYILYKRKGI